MKYDESELSDALSGDNESENDESEYDDDDSMAESSAAESSDDEAWREDDGTENLPTLLNSTRRRKKTIETYIAPVHMRETVYRCQEFPNGVYIDRQGCIQPKHPKSGPPSQGKRKRTTSEAGQQRSKRSRVVEEDNENSEEEDFTLEDLIESGSSEDDDVGAPEDDDASDQSEVATLLSDLQQGTQACKNLYTQSLEAKRRHTKSMKLVRTTQDMVEEWFNIKKMKGRHLHMTYESSLLVEHPSFTFTFTSLLEKKAKEPTRTVTAALVCEDLTVRCQCGFVCETVTDLVAHLKQEHWPMLGHIDEVKDAWSDDKIKKTTLTFSYKSSEALYISFKGNTHTEILVSPSSAQCTTCRVALARNFASYREHHLAHC
jgi:hypothetical protein